ncbi:MAG TPA: hypothetical protein VD906_00420 [Caulobacteraceae bacterium]|nr:hypothetical protein [Caulobacteraceae bacterium]
MLRTIFATVVLALGALAFAPQALAMTFQRLDGSAACRGYPCVLAVGEIDRKAADDFQALLGREQVPPGATVIFDSEGGSVLESLALGDAIRDAGLFTAVGRYHAPSGRFIVGGQCVSACAYAFLGGVQRHVGEHARVGVHQFSSAPEDKAALTVADAQHLMGLIAIYLDRMVGKSTVLALAAATPPASTRWLSSHELRSHRMVTN